MARRQRNGKSRERWLRKYVGDIRHALQCCRAGRLPPEHVPFLEGVLIDPRLPSPDELAQAVGLTFEQREANKLWTIPCVDKTVDELAALRRKKDRERKKVARRKAQARTREAYLASVSHGEPWKREGISRATWFRRRGETGCSKHQVTT
jgi:hypothetical protein